METLGILIGLFPLLLVGVGVWVGWWFLTGRYVSEARTLQQKFYNLNPLKGKTRTQIESVVGRPQSWAALGDNRTSCTWNSNGHRYMITLIFDGEVCEGVSSEITV
jgi:hypothetical protein